MQKATEIVLTLHEGPKALCDKPISFRTWEAAESHLRQWQTLCNPEPGMGYYKTKYEVNYPDGLCAVGRYDIDSDPVNLVSAVRRTLQITSGQHKPAPWSIEQYATYLNRCGAAKVAIAARMLAECQIGDHP